ncbi:MAG TPA: BatD family protein [Candidatus Udaeobacter sp.]|nr:BatD family protein [Candidatus Udaeobacter sp.]
MRCRGIGRFAPGAGQAFAVFASLVLLSGAPASSADAPPIEARMLRTTLSIGESTSLEILVRGNPAAEPQFVMPAGLDLLSSGRMQNFSWVNGRGSSETVFRYEIAAAQAGRWSLGPFRVGLGGQVLVAPAIEVTVTAASTSISGGSGGPAALIADVEPREPYVGQPVILRVRLVQRAQLAEDPQYVPPATPGFWSESASRPESYYAAERNRRVLVTETRTRLYPLATGVQTIGEAVAQLALLEAGSDDPSAWLAGRVPRREVVVKSTPIRVHVRPLPPGAPAGFDGVVGVLSARWSADRQRTSRDVPITARLDVRGVGNLPLAHAPALTSDDFEVFTAATDDSFAGSGQPTPGRRAFQWTLLARREGRLRLPTPRLVWFDPVKGEFRSLDVPALTVDIGPALAGGSGTSAAFPLVFVENDVTPFARYPQPWAFGLAGVMLGAAFALLRAASRPSEDAGERARQRERLRAVGLAQGPDFWRAADEASSWLESRGRPVRAIRDSISAARFGGAAPDETRLRRQLIEQLSALLPAERRPLPLRIAACAMIVAAIALVVLFRGGASDFASAGARELEIADTAARGGDMDRARAEWIRLWKEGAREAGLAARLGWAEIRSGSVGPAAAWVLAGEIGDPRDPGLEWVRQRVQEAGGLIGASGGRWPVRRLEWAILALLLGVAAGLLWPRRWVSLSLLFLTVAAAAMFPIQTYTLRHSGRAVVRAPVPLDSAGLELETGQVVRIVERQGGRVRATAGRGVTAWIPVRSVYAVEDLR